MKKRLIILLLRGLYVPDRKAIARHIAESLDNLHREDLIRSMIPEGKHIHSNGKRRRAA